MLANALEKAYMNRNGRKPTFVFVRLPPTHPAKIQIIQHIRLIRIFTWRILDSQEYKISPYGQWTLWSECADVQADLKIFSAHDKTYVFSRCGSFFNRKLKHSLFL